MSCHYLRENFDIHGGGPDLIFPHHENEWRGRAKRRTEVRELLDALWSLRVRSADGTEEKMSKSLHNFWTIRDALKETDEQFGAGTALRCFASSFSGRSTGARSGTSLT